MNIHGLSIKKILDRLGIEELNELQSATLKAVRQDQDLILLSDTGSGKTLAFLLPILSMMDKQTPSTQALVS